LKAFVPYYVIETIMYHVMETTMLLIAFVSWFEYQFHFILICLNSERHQLKSMPSRKARFIIKLSSTQHVFMDSVPHYLLSCLSTFAPTTNACHLLLLRLRRLFFRRLCNKCATRPEPCCLSSWKPCTR